MRPWIFPSSRTTGAPHPRFPVESRGFPALHAPFLKRKAHTQSCLGPRAENSGYLAGFSRDVGYHSSGPAYSCHSHKRLRFVVSHISPKTSEMWGTRRSAEGKGLKKLC